MADIDWTEDATLYVQLPLADGTTTSRAVYLGPLRGTIELALGGQHGPLSMLLIETDSGFVFGPEILEEIARLRSRWKLKN